MNKTSKFFAAFAAVALMSACSSEEPAVNGGENDGIKDGQKAYLAVTINSTGDMGRSTDFDTPTYKDGDEFEHKVESASFFFFDGQGNYVMKASVVDPAFGEGSPKPNIEWMSTKNILVLEDLKSNNYPEYMLTVLNMSDFTAETTLSATTQKLSDYVDNFTADKKNFVMSTTAYFGENNNHDNTYYNVTKLHSDNFKLTADEAQNNSPVDVYVERLAAKVQVSVSDDIETEVINGKTYYVLRQTVAGGGNDNGTTEDGLANTKVYLEVVGWGLNATATQSYIGKQLLPEWEKNNPFTAWQNAGYYRSFWAYSLPYAEGADEPVLAYTNTTKLTTPATLDYAEYCYENTNSAANIFKKNNAGQNLVIPSKVTHVVLYTKIHNADGKVQNVVEYRGVPYLEETFKAYLLNSFKNSTKGLNYYYLTGTTTEGDATTNSYAQVAADDIVFEGTGELGKVNIVLANPEKALYKKTVVEGKEVYVKLEGADNDLADRLKAFQGTDTDNKLIPLDWHNQGANLYYIPIEQAATAANKDKDGYYGVVRNHWYKLSINSFSKLGHAAYDPENGSETIKPTVPEDPLYYVGARINVLSWRIISQNVDL